MNEYFRFAIYCAIGFGGYHFYKKYKEKNPI
jgi:hypothetical protein